MPFTVKSPFLTPVPITDGGTGANNAEDARDNLGITIGASTILGTTDEILVENGDGALGDPTISIANNPIIPGVESITVPHGTTLDRPVTPALGMFRGNDDTNEIECYTGGAWEDVVYRVFNYTQAFWVSQSNGSDLNSGTSIETPFQTFGAAIAAAVLQGTTCVIYGVDGNSNNIESLTIPTIGQVINIVAPGTSFSGAITLDLASQFTINCESFIAGSMVNNGANTVNISCSGTFGATYTQTAPSNVTVVASNISNVSLSNGGTFNFTCAGLVINDGTTVVNGVLGGTGPGFANAAVIGGELAFGDLTQIAYKQTNLAPTSANQVLFSSGAGPGASTFWASLSTSSHIYTQAYWVDDVNGNDANSGLSINEPFLTYQFAISLIPASTPTIIYGVNGSINSEIIATQGIGQIICIEAPGTTFAQTLTIELTDEVTIRSKVSQQILNKGLLFSYSDQLGQLDEQGSSYVESAYCVSIIQSPLSQSYVRTKNAGFYFCDGSRLQINTESAGNFNLQNSSELSLLSAVPCIINNDGTCTVSGYAGTRVLGGAGLEVSNPLGTIAQYILTNNAPSAANEVLLSTGAGPGTSATWGSALTGFNLTGPISSVGAATSITSQTGTGTTFVMETSPTLITPALGVATASSVNKVAITAPATAATLTIADGKTLTQNNSLTYSGTDGASVNFGAGGTVSYLTGAFQSIVTQVFASSGTYTPTAGMKYCIIEVLGGGGGGGGVTGVNAQSACGAGGGAGGYSRKSFDAATIGASKTVTIGALGAGGIAGNNPGSAGGTTSVATLISASGGAGGSGGAASNATAFSGAGGPAGVGSLGDFNVGGTSGGRGHKIVGTSAISGAGGSSVFGGGGAIVTGSSPGGVAQNYGSGGSGATSTAAGSQAGGNGSPGFVIVTEYI